MVLETSGIGYMPVLKWKQGEYRAFRDLSVEDWRATVPLFDIPPAGNFDHQSGRVLEPAEHIGSFGGRLAENCGRHLVFIDGGWVDDDEHRGGLTVHPMTALLERSLVRGGLAAPSTGLRRSDEYQAAVRRFLTRNGSLPACIRLEAEDLEAANLNQSIDGLLETISVAPHQCVLVIDLKAREIVDAAAFAEMLLVRINDLPHLKTWRDLVLVQTAYPERSKIKLKPGQVGRFRRQEWQVFIELLQRASRLVRVPKFGDYGTEHPSKPVVLRVSPTAHFRYTTEAAHLMVKGTTTRQPHGYAAIFPVADQLISLPEFAGANFSSGDAYIARLASVRKSTGHAAGWRQATTSHHLAHVLAALRKGGQIAPQMATQVREPVQATLFD